MSKQASIIITLLGLILLCTVYLSIQESKKAKILAHDELLNDIADKVHESVLKEKYRRALAEQNKQ